MTMKGMDIEAGRQSAQTIQQGSQELEQLTNTLTQSLESFQWIGPDADRTRQSWQSEHRTALTNISQALQEFSTLINNQAQEQEQVSS
ncbi:hypothetical protein G5V58_04800 [Nocardioides anomalus]|uniref:WXG100 family type VII secretion target n=1 Tax=Nocardioides anomalus TaxID=2712223 RepID=A0A6G6WAK1_9ACTN|nr:hypothetical protein [Nocardioides anomalus]QIG42173.1 hypothetical protein G5V58_04800 [Nocardioides anomalus]